MGKKEISDSKKKKTRREKLEEIGVYKDKLKDALVRAGHNEERADDIIDNTISNVIIKYMNDQANNKPELEQIFLDYYEHEPLSKMIDDYVEDLDEEVSILIRDNVGKMQEHFAIELLTEMLFVKQYDSLSEDESKDMNLLWLIIDYIDIRLGRPSTTWERFCLLEAAKSEKPKVSIRVDRKVNDNKDKDSPKKHSYTEETILARWPKDDDGRMTVEIDLKEAVNVLGAKNYQEVYNKSYLMSKAKKTGPGKGKYKFTLDNFLKGLDD